MANQRTGDGVNQREAEELLRQSEQALEQGLKGDAALDAARDRAEAGEHPLVTEEDLRIVALQQENASLNRRLDETIELIQKYGAAGNFSVVTDEARKRDFERLKMAKVRAMIAKGGDVTILIHPGSTAAESQPVPVGINGYNIQVPRGIPTKVPVEFLEVLELARQEHTSMVVDSAGNPVAQHVSLTSYPYTVIDHRPGPSRLERMAA